MDANWIIGDAERTKSSGDFQTLSGGTSLISGNIARDFFLRSGLPMPVLGVVWGLSDIDHDGKMDVKEFTLAVHLIRKKLQGIDLPHSLPQSLIHSAESRNNSISLASGGGGASFMPPLTSNLTMTPNLGVTSSPGTDNTMKQTMNSNYISHNTITTSPVKAAAWNIPQLSVYKSMFNKEDTKGIGFLTGIEARNVLSKTGLPFPRLAQLWTLADIDSDGKLSEDEFCVAMHLIELTKKGASLPNTLPSELIPPQYRKSRAGSFGISEMIPSSGGMAPSMVVGFSSTSTNANSNDLSAAFNVINSDQDMQENFPATFEDKRKANFDKGQAVLDRRRQQLKDNEQQDLQNRKDAEARDAEKKLKIKQEQESRRQIELDRQREQQKKLDQEREEQRQLVWQQRETQRKEVERQRQLDNDLKQRQQMTSDLQRVEELVDNIKADVSKLKLEREAMGTKKIDIKSRIDIGEAKILSLTSEINGMRESRDSKIMVRDKLQHDIIEWNNKANLKKREKISLEAKVESQCGALDTSLHAAQQTLISHEKSETELGEKLKKEKDTSSLMLTDLEKIVEKHKEMKIRLERIREEQKIKKALKLKQETENQKNNEYSAFSSNGITNGFSSSQHKDPFAAFNSSHNDNDLFGNTDNLFNSAFEFNSSSVGSLSTMNSTNTTHTKSAWNNALNDDKKKSFDSAFSTSLSTNEKPQKYEAMYNFDARNPDEISFVVGQIIWVHSDQSGAEQAWMKGNVDGNEHSGFFPEAYVQIFSENISSGFNTVSFDAIDPIDTAGSASFDTGLTVKVNDNKSPTLDTDQSNTTYTVLYSYSANNFDQLAVEEREVVTILSTSADQQWIKASIGERSGWLPRSYVRLSSDTSNRHPREAPPPPLHTSYSDHDDLGGSNSEIDIAMTGEPYIALFTYDSSVAGDLSFSRGDRVIVISKVDADWWTGRIQETGKEGIFPSNYVGQLEDLTSTQCSVDESGEPAISSPIQVMDAGTINKNEDEIDDKELGKEKEEKEDDPEINSKEDVTNELKESNTDYNTISIDDKKTFEIKPHDEIIDNKIELDISQSATTATPPTMQPTTPPTTPQTTPQTTPKTTPHTTPQNTPHTTPHTTPIKYNTPSLPNDSEQHAVPTDTLKKVETPDVILTPSKCQESTAENVQTTVDPEIDSMTLTLTDPVKKINPLRASPVKVVSPTKDLVKETCTVQAPYEAAGPEQLTLKIGEIIAIRKKSPSGWWQGEISVAGEKRRVGWFPANYVEIDDVQEDSPVLSATTEFKNKETRSSTPSSSLPAPTTTPSLEQVKAIYAYKGQNHDELDFEANDIINVIDNEDPDWWMGELNGVTGVFPVNYVTTNETVSTSSDYDQNERYTLAVREFINTEEKYVKDLALVSEVFEKKLLEDKVLSKFEATQIFVNLDDVYKCNSKFMKALRVRDHLGDTLMEKHMIGDILCEYIPTMTPYIRFCSMQLKASSLIQYKYDNDENFRFSVKQACKNPVSCGLPLNAYLLKVVQRITRYELLIKNILKHASNDNPDRIFLQLALEKAIIMCSQVNEGVREKDNSDKLEWIQNYIQCFDLDEKLTFNSLTNSMGPRKLISYGILHKAKSNRQLIVFLFNDFILLTTSSSQHNYKDSSIFNRDRKSQLKMYRKPIFLADINIESEDILSEETDQSLTSINLTLAGHPMTLKSHSQIDRDKWIKKLTEAKEIYMEKENSLKTSLEGSVKKTKQLGRLLVIIIAGYNLLSPGSKCSAYCEAILSGKSNKTSIINEIPTTLWNTSMQFPIFNLKSDKLTITVYNHDYFSPDDFLGRTEIKISDILKRKQMPSDINGSMLCTQVPMRLKLYEGKGEIKVKFDLQIFEK